MPGYSEDWRSADNSLYKLSDCGGWRLQEKAWEALKAAETKNGRLALSQFRRLKQLGTGDVGLVDMVELQDGSGRSASSFCLTTALGLCYHQAGLRCVTVDHTKHASGEPPRRRGQLMVAFLP